MCLSVLKGSILLMAMSSTSWLMAKSKSSIKPFTATISGKQTTMPNRRPIKSLIIYLWTGWLNLHGYSKRLL